MSKRLEDIEDIRQLKYRYFRCIDTANLTELAELFTEDASVKYEGGSYTFETQGRDEIIAAIEYGFHAEAIAWHHGNHPEIKILSDTEAEGTWYLRDWFLDLRRKVITDGSALYRDQYVKQNGKWLIQHSGYTRVFEIVEEVTKTPNITAHYLAKHGKKLPPDADQNPSVGQ